jgi:hypothetical protein
LFAAGAKTINRKNLSALREIFIAGLALGFFSRNNAS